MQDDPQRVVLGFGMVETTYPKEADVDTLQALLV